MVIRVRLPFNSVETQQGATAQKRTVTELYLLYGSIQLDVLYTNVEWKICLFKGNFGDFKPAIVAMCSM